MLGGGGEQKPGRGGSFKGLRLRRSRAAEVLLALAICGYMFVTSRLALMGQVGRLGEAWKADLKKGFLDGGGGGRGKAGEPGAAPQANGGEGEEDGEEVASFKTIEEVDAEVEARNVELEDAAMRRQSDESRWLPRHPPYHFWTRFRGLATGFPRETARDQAKSAAARYIKFSNATAAMPLRDDGTCRDAAAEGPAKGKAACSGNGACQRGKCVCLAQFRDEACATLRDTSFPRYQGDLVLSRRRLRQDRGVRFKVDPKADPGAAAPQPFLRVPITKEVWAAQPASDLLRAAMYPKCAVVGSTGSTKLFALGHHIDAADAVFRVGRNPVKKWERYVGSKTTHRVGAASSIGFQEFNEDMFLAMDGPDRLMLHAVLHRRHPHANLYLLHSEFYDYIRALAGDAPSPGLIAVMTALQVCARVTVYGFHRVGGASGSMATNTYFGASFDKGTRREPAQEKAVKVINVLASSGIVKLGEPCVEGCSAGAEMTACRHCTEGTQCVCDSHLRVPVTKPGYCHQRGDLSCIIKCQKGVAECPGGSSGSICPRAYTPKYLKVYGLKCTKSPKAHRHHHHNSTRTAAHDGPPAPTNGEEHAVDALAPGGAVEKLRR